MDILLLGVSNVGKSSIGELLAKKIHYDYYDLDDIVKNVQTLSFLFAQQNELSVQFHV